AATIGVAPTGATSNCSASGAGTRRPVMAARWSGVSWASTRRIARMAIVASVTPCRSAGRSTPGTAPNAIANRRSAEATPRVPSGRTFATSVCHADAVADRARVGEAVGPTVDVAGAVATGVGAALGAAVGAPDVGAPEGVGGAAEAGTVAGG